MTTFSLIPTLATIGDPDGTRTVTSIVALLVALGLGLLLLAVWIFRTTRPDPELLAPLEAMGERAWRRGDPVWQRRRLDELRPDGAKPLAPSVAPPEFDASFDEGPTASGFDDLRSGYVVPYEAPLTVTGDGPKQGAGDDLGGESREDVTVDVDADAADDDADDRPDETAAERTPVDATPSGAAGPDLDEFPDDEFDPDALAAARAELERELAESAGSSRARQLDLFGRDGDD